MIRLAADLRQGAGRPGPRARRWSSVRPWSWSSSVVVVVVVVVVVGAVVVDVVGVVDVVVAVVLVGAVTAGLGPVVGGAAAGGGGAHAARTSAEIERTARPHHKPRLERCGPRLRMPMYRHAFVQLDGRAHEVQALTSMTSSFSKGDRGGSGQYPEERRREDALGLRRHRARCRSTTPG